MSELRRFFPITLVLAGLFALACGGGGGGNDDDDGVHCGPGTHAVGDQCVPDDPGDPCDGMNCPHGCANGVCNDPSDPCAQLNCPFGCEEGACLPEPNITADEAEDIALDSLSQLDLQNQTEGLADFDNYAPELIRGSVRGVVRGAQEGVIRGKAARGIEMSQAPIEAIPDCMWIYRWQPACCASDDPCGWADDGICDCDGFEAWDAGDCESTGPSDCCAPDDPCGWADDEICDCNGELAFDMNDCLAEQDCCAAGDPCGWAGDGYCDCYGIASWDTADCQEYLDCCAPDDPCGWADDNVCDCWGDPAWDLADCSGQQAPLDDCCAPGDPCGWADDEFCDCYGTMDWETSDCEGVTIEESGVSIFYDGECLVDGVVYTGEMNIFNYNYQSADFSYMDTSMYFEDYTEDGVPYEGEAYANTSYYSDESCVFFETGVTYEGFRTPDSGYVDGEFNVYESQCDYGYGPDIWNEYEFEDFIYGCERENIAQCDFINLTYQFTFYDGESETSMRLSGAVDGVPLASFYEYIETLNEDGTVTFEGLGANFSTEAGGEVSLDFLYTLAEEACGQIPQSGYMNMAFEEEAKTVTFNCGDLGVE